MKQAVILAAGQGSRLNGADGRPKCLSRVGDATLIDHQIRSLRRLGIEQIAVVVGYRRHEIEQVLRDRVHYIINDRYSTTNSLYSLWLARSWIVGDFVLVNGDVLAHPAIFSRLAAVKGNALAFDSSSGEEAEHMKVYSPNGLLRSIGKSLPLAMTSGENVGILRFTAVGARRLFKAAGQLITNGGNKFWAPAAVDRVARLEAIECVDIAGMDWVEIDFPQDLRKAQERMWPVLAAAPA